jgi:hypothetical protein
MDLIGVLITCQVSAALLPVDQAADARSHAAVVLAEAEG